MPAKPIHHRLLTATYLTCGWIFVVVFLPVFRATTDLVVVVSLGVFLVATALVVVGLVSLAVDRRLPPMRDLTRTNLSFGQNCWVAAAVTGVAALLVSLALAAFLPGPMPELETSLLWAIPFWAASMGAVAMARPAQESGPSVASR